MASFRTRCAPKARQASAGVRRGQRAAAPSATPGVPRPLASASLPARLPSAAAFNDLLRRRSLLPRIPPSAGLSWRRRDGRGAETGSGPPRDGAATASPGTRQRSPPSAGRSSPRRGRPRPPAASVPPPPPSHWPGTVRAYAFRISIGRAG